VYPLGCAQTKLLPPLRLNTISPTEPDIIPRTWVNKRAIEWYSFLFID
jgi:hypothetical protein